MVGNVGARNATYRIINIIRSWLKIIQNFVFVSTFISFLCVVFSFLLLLIVRHLRG